MSESLKEKEVNKGAIHESSPWTASVTHCDISGIWVIFTFFQNLWDVWIDWLLSDKTSPSPEIYHSWLRMRYSTLSSISNTIRLKKGPNRTSQVVQWLGLHLPMPEVRVQSLVRELGSYMPCGQKTETWNRSNIVTNSIRTLIMVYINRI